MTPYLVRKANKPPRRAAKPHLREIIKEPLLISYRNGKSLKDKLVKAKLLRLLDHHGHTAEVALVCQTYFRHVFSCTSAALSGLVKSYSLKCCERKDNVSPCTQLKVDRFFHVFSVELDMFRHTRESYAFLCHSQYLSRSHIAV